MTDADATYTPSYYDEGVVGLPAPEGVYGTEIHSTSTIAEHTNEAQLLLDLMKTQDPLEYSKLTKTSAKMPVLIKVVVPGEGRVKMILRLAPYEQYPFLQVRTQINGKILALLEDIDKVTEAPSVIVLNDTILRKLRNVMAPTEAQFIEKCEKKDDRDDGAMWFKQAKVATTTVEVAQVCPIPAIFAYDALMEAVPAHVLWERIKSADMPNNNTLKEHILEFLQAVHTDHNASNTATVDIGSTTFLARQRKDEKQWAKEKAAKLFTSVRVAGTAAAALPASPAQGQQGAQDFQKLAEAMLAIQTSASPAKAGAIPIVADTDATLLKKYGMMDINLDRMLKQMCGLKSGQEDQFPDWIETTATTGLSKEGKKTTIRKTLLKDPRYDEHPIPITPPVLLKMIADKEFAGDDDHTTAAGAMKGLSPYMMASMTADKIVEANEYAQALEESRAATVAEIRSTQGRQMPQLASPTCWIC